MGSLERSKKGIHLWKKAMIRFSLCFVMGFFTGFAPTGKSSFVLTQLTSASTNGTSKFAPQALEMSHDQTTNVNRSLISQKTGSHVQEDQPSLKPGKHIIIITPTSNKIPYEAVLLRRLANTIKLVPQPLLWIVVEPPTESTELSEILRKTGIMYRHLVSNENFTDLEAELNHQRNLALKHIEHHKLSGIVHFAGLSNAYDLEFFRQLRDIEVFGTWPVALLAANRKKVIIEGPVCDSSQVIGWHLNNFNNDSVSSTINISSFAFNSSILWDPERWGRTSSVQDTSQNSINIVKQVVLEDESKLNGIPSEGCSRIMLWRFNFQPPIISRYQILSSASNNKTK